MSWADVEKTETTKIPYTKFREGSTVIRILDSEPYSFWQHWLQVQKSAVTCIGKGCPICNVIAEDRANKITPRFGNSQRHAMRVWNYSTNQMEIMIQGRKFMNQLLTLNKEIGDLKDYDVKVVRTGSGKDTTYSVLPSQPSEFTHMEEVSTVDMADQFKAPDRDAILQLMDGKTWAEINVA